MPALSYEDKTLIKHYRLDKGYGAKRIVQEFPHKNWKLSTINKFLRKLATTGSIERAPGSGRPRTVRVEETIHEVEERIVSQEEQPGTHSTQREISANLGISLGSVNLILKEAGLHAFKKVECQKLSVPDKEKRLQRCALLQNFLTPANLDRTFFTDEKIFKLEKPHNNQNDRVYARNRNDISNDRLLVEHSKFPPYLMVWAGVSCFGKTSFC